MPPGSGVVVLDVVVVDVVVVDVVVVVVVVVDASCESTGWVWGDEYEPAEATSKSGLDSMGEDLGGER